MLLFACGYGGRGAQLVLSFYVNPGEWYYIYIYVCVCVCVCVCVYVYACIYMCVCVCTNLSLSLSVFIVNIAGDFFFDFFCLFCFDMTHVCTLLLSVEKHVIL